MLCHKLKLDLHQYHTNPNLFLEFFISYGFCIVTRTNFFLRCTEKNTKKNPKKQKAPKKIKSWGNLLKRAQKNFERFSTKKICLRAKPVVMRAKTVNHELKFVI